MIKSRFNLMSLQWLTFSNPVRKNLSKKLNNTPPIRDDLPLPLTPVITHIWLSGILTVMFLRLFKYASSIII